MYRAMVQHYGDKATEMQTGTKVNMMRYIAQQYEVLKGYNKRYFETEDGRFVILNEDDTFKTTFWVEKKKK